MAQIPLPLFPASIFPSPLYQNVVRISKLRRIIIKKKYNTTGPDNVKKYLSIFSYFPCPGTLSQLSPRFRNGGATQRTPLPAGFRRSRGGPGYEKKGRRPRRRSPAGRPPCRQ